MKSFTPMNGGLSLPLFVKALLCSFLLAGLTTGVHAQATLDPSQPSLTRICTGSNVNFYVFATAASGTITYQWQESTDGGITWNNLVEGSTAGVNPGNGIYTGTTSAALTITHAPATMDGYKYRSNVYVNGTNMVTSAQGILNVAPNVSLDNATQTNCPATSSTLNTAGVAGVSYQWQVSSNGGSSWANVTDGADPSGATYTGGATGTLTIGSLTTNIDGYLYRYTANDGTCNITSGITTQRVPAIAIYTLPTSVTSNIGESASIPVTITAGTGPYTYQWQVAVGFGGFTNILSTNAAYSGATTGTLTILNVSTATYSNRYRVLIKNPGNCASAVAAFTQIGSPVVLPLTITGLTAQKQGASSSSSSSSTASSSSPSSTVFAVKLSWTVQTAYTSFAVERAVDGGAFADAGSVPAVAGVSDYTYTDEFAGNGQLQYRIKAIDPSGAAVYSAVADVAGDASQDQLELRPSVVSSGGTLSLYSLLSNGSPLVLTVTDVTGRMLWTTTVEPGKGANYTPLDVARLAKGMYYVRVVHSNGLVRTLPFVRD